MNETTTTLASEEAIAWLATDINKASNALNEAWITEQKAQHEIETTIDRVWCQGALESLEFVHNYLTGKDVN